MEKLLIGCYPKVYFFINNLGVIAISPELGEQTYSNFFSNFFPDQEKTLKLFKTEFPPLIHFINYLPFQPFI